MRRISNLENIKVLAREEAEEAARAKGVNRSSVKGLSIATYELIDTVDRYHLGFQEVDGWLFLSDFVLSSGLLADLGIFKNVETFLDIRSSF